MKRMKIEVDNGDDGDEKPEITPELEVMVCTVVEAMLSGRDWAIVMRDGSTGKIISSMEDPVSMTAMLIISAAQMIGRQSGLGVKISDLFDEMIRNIERSIADFKARNPEP